MFLVLFILTLAKKKEAKTVTLKGPLKYVIPEIKYF